MNAYFDLIQLYYTQKKDARAETVKSALRKLRASGKSSELKDSQYFPVNKFSYGDCTFVVTEKFDVSGGMIYYPWMCYVYGADGGCFCSINLEYDAIAEEMEGIKYLLGRSDMDGGHKTYGIGFKEMPSMEEFEQLVKDCIDGKMSSSASSVRK